MNAVAPLYFFYMYEGHKTIIHKASEEIFIRQTYFWRHNTQIDVVSLCSKIVYKNVSYCFQQLQKLDEVINLCLHHVSHKDNKIRSIYLDLLGKIPLSCISHALCTAHLCDDSEYTANKVRRSLIVF